jgi:hypothetical protein
MTYIIKKPEWQDSVGCLCGRSILTPEGWVGLRKESRWWTVTGVNESGWKDFESFGTEEDAANFAEKMYYEQVEKLVKRWLL